MNGLLRYFVVDRFGETTVQSFREFMAAGPVPPEVLSAAEIMLDAGLPPKKASDMAWAAYRNWEQGKSSMNPDQFARHFIKLSRAFVQKETS